MQKKKKKKKEKKRKDTSINKKQHSTKCRKS